MAGFGGGIGGLGESYRVHEAASWVDQSKPPGHTSTGPRTAQPGWWYSWPKAGLLGLGLPFVYSPNLVWFGISLAVYAAEPYPGLDGGGGAGVDWRAECLKRLAINAAVGLGYIGYWHCSLYRWSFSGRKFHPANDGPPAARMLHNVWYTLLGIAQWTAWEMGFVYCFASGRVAFTTDAQLLAGGWPLAWTVIWTLALPVFRDFHFYFAHRLVHIRALYKYVHSLHHRNNDPEPFSGLCMHPIEHMYYLSCAALSLYVNVSPFVLTFNLIHAVLAPAAGHSGFEDHWQSDQFHHLHHQFFEVNYGNIGFPWDAWFGTQMTSLSKEGQSAYHGDADVSDKSKLLEPDVADVTAATSATTTDKKTDKEQAKKPATYMLGGLSLAWAFPRSADHALYWVFTSLLPLLLLKKLSSANFLGRWPLWGLPLFVTLGPLLWALALALLFKDRQSPLWPFHKEGVFGRLGFHLLFGVIMVLYPTYDFLATVIT